MARKQLLIALGIFAAMIVTLAAAWAGLGNAPVDEVSTAERLALAARWLLVPALCLMVGVGAAASRRFLSAAMIDGARSSDDPVFDINLRYNLNTVEQLCLAAIAWIGLVLVLALPARDLSLIPVLAGLFAAGRFTFWVGYLAAPWARAFGMAVTLLPTAAALVWLSVQAI